MNPREQLRELWEYALRRERNLPPTAKWDKAFADYGVAIDVALNPPIAEWPKPPYPARTNESVRLILAELQQVRNVIVHRGKVVDKYLAAAGYLGQFRSDGAGTFRLGDPLEIDGNHMQLYWFAVTDYYAACIAAAGNRIYEVEGGADWATVPGGC